MYEKGYQETLDQRQYWRIFEKKIAYIIAIPLIGLLLSVFAFHFYRIDGPSMEGTLYNNDRVIIGKMGKTLANITGKNFVPKRYDVVVFDNPNSSGEKQVIKRVVGLPGERIVVLNNDVRIFNSENPEGFLVDRQAPAEAIIDDVTPGFTDEVIGPDEIFVLGDNRDASYDSRFTGPVKADKVVGKLTMRFYPINRITLY
jgi:signal peptidase I